MNVEGSTTRTTIYISYNSVQDDGGSAITKYNVYVDDGNDGPFSGPYDNGMLLTYDTGALSLTTGLTYRLKYSAVNSEGEGELSDEVAILMAETPGIPQSFARTGASTLSAGTISVSWSIPADNGGSTITGYKLYVNDLLHLSAPSTMTAYTITSLSVGISYKVSVTAVNAVGESAKNSLNLLSASVPQRLSAPTWSSSTSTSIKVQWSTTSFNGGDDVTGYLVRGDNGPLTAWQTAVSTASLTNDFTGLSTGVAYRF